MGKLSLAVVITLATGFALVEAVGCSSAYDAAADPSAGETSVTDPDGSATSDSASLVEGGGEAGSGLGCPSGRGPVMARVGGYCVDTTEITQEQYLAFTQDKAGDTTGQKPECAWNTAYGAGCGFNPSLRPTYPVEAVDWCDATAFCKWSGKRLCGGAEGIGTQNPSVLLQTNANQWYSACTGGGSLAYPYGEFYSAAACNGTELPRDGGPTGALPVATLAGCVGGFPGLHDLTGNVFEWVDFCSASTIEAGAPGAGDTCSVMGGNYTQGGVAQRCAYNNGYARNYSFCGFGFRCCADPK